mgnify:FL=1
MLWLLPIVLTYLIIWIFPKWISIPAFKKDVEYKTEKRRIEITAQKDLESQKIAELNVATVRIKKEKEVTKTKKEIEKIDPAQKWEGEYQNFKAQPLFSKFQSIIAAIYEHNGKISIYDSYNERYSFQIPKDILAYSHTNDLVTFDKTKESIELTEKGKLFVRQYSTDTTPSF